jgi:hypothetical protein
MKITCAPDKGGCGERFTVTEDLLAEYKRYAESGVESGCPNTECDRLLTVEELHKLVTVVEERQKPKLRVLGPEPDPTPNNWPGFPLDAPIIPAGRRKNGARPGVCFRKIGERAPDRPPTPQEILRVQQFFAERLDDGGDCPCCTRHARRQHRALGCGPARWLIELVYLSGEGQAVHTGEILKALKGNNVSGSDATSVLPLYGLIEAAPDPEAASNPPPPTSRGHAKGRTSGFWRPTKLGRAFALDKVKVPERIVTCLGVPEAFEGEAVSIKEALGKKFNYDTIMGREGAK